MQPTCGTVFNRRNLLAALLAMALCGCDLFVTPVNTGEIIMSDLTKTMRPVCLGRLVVEIPTVAKINGWSQKVDDTKIVSVEHPSPNRKTFARRSQSEPKIL
jgi:hypothetical protein